jgi:hypothetical protein
VRHNRGSGAWCDEPWILTPPVSWAYARVVEAFQVLGLDMPKVSFVTLPVHLRLHLLASGQLISVFPKFGPPPSAPVLKTVEAAVSNRNSEPHHEWAVIRVGRNFRE